jgi:hypothetical protein
LPGGLDYRARCAATVVRLHMNHPTVPQLAQCSISWQGYKQLLQKLEIQALDLGEFSLPAFNTHQLRQILLERGIYPARDFPELIARRLPDVFVTYDWRENVLAVRATAGLAMQNCLRFQTNRFPNADLDAVLYDGVTFWLDWIFLDQASRDVDRELDEILPALFNDGTVHVVASTTALSRAWCCYELAQFNRHAAQTPGANLTSLIPADLQKYPLWAAVASTDPADKLRVEKRIVELFPGGLHALEHLMVQAGLTADMGAYPSATLERISVAADRWIERFDGS